MGHPAYRKAPDINDRADLTGKQDFDEILSASQVCAQSIDRSVLHTVEIIDRRGGYFTIFHRKALTQKDI